MEVDSRATIALVGNPNCGKTTLFNLLTGMQQSVGNWPGVTVERHAGVARLDVQTRVAVIDLPGIYSLLGGGGEDQAVARHFLRDEAADLIVQVLDASNLERHLLLTAELLALRRPLLLVLNMVDEARDRGWQVDAAALAKRLGVTVVPMVARKGRGLRELRAGLLAALQHPPRASEPKGDDALQRAIAALAAEIGGERSHFLACQYLELPETVPPALQGAVQRVARQLQQAFAEDPADLLPAARFAWAAEIHAAVAQQAGAQGWRRRLTRHLDRWVLHDWLGVPIFLAVLYLIFVVSFSAGNVFLDLFDQASAAILMHGFGHVLLLSGAPDWVINSLAGGIGGGLNLVISFIPPIGLTFLFLAFLEDSGYMARAAYVMDRLMRRVGLPGNAFVPMVIGFGCNVPAILGARIIDDPRGRVLTVLMQPFMSCSARLTIYMAFAVVFFRGSGGQVVFLLYLTGILMALFTAWLLGKTALRGEARSFVMELPPYRLPSLRSVALQAWQRLKIFVLRVGKVIAAIGFVLFLLPGIGWTSQGLRATDIDHSLMAQGSRALAPIFAPMGISADNWPAVAGLVASAAAKEVVIGALNGIYQRQEGEICWRNIAIPIWARSCATPWTPSRKTSASSGVVLAIPSVLRTSTNAHRRLPTPGQAPRRWVLWRAALPPSLPSRTCCSCCCTCPVPAPWVPCGGRWAGAGCSFPLSTVWVWPGRSQPWCINLGPSRHIPNRVWPGAPALALPSCSCSLAYASMAANGDRPLGYSGKADAKSIVSDP